MLMINDGGRSAAGFRGLTGDCVTRSIAIATDQPYIIVYEKINELSKRFAKRFKKSAARTGVEKKVYSRYLRSQGWERVSLTKQRGVPRARVGECELPNGALILDMYHHVSCMVDGVIHDTFDVSGQVVFGYWRKKDE